MGGVWKLEPQTRGAPHFHLLTVGAPFLAKEWLSRSWYEVVGSHDQRHLSAGTNVQLARSHRGVVAYAAKYVAKHQALPTDWQDGVGRWWGVFNRAALRIEWLEAPMTEPMYWSAVRIVRRLVASRTPAATRGPPRSFSGGCWAVLKEAEARRVWSHLLDNACATSVMVP